MSRSPGACRFSFSFAGAAEKARGRSESTSAARAQYFDQCSKIFEKEIKIVDPTHIIFFVGENYKDLINNFKYGYPNSEILDKKKKKIKKKYGGFSDVIWCARAKNKEIFHSVELEIERSPETTLFTPARARMLES